MSAWRVIAGRFEISQEDFGRGGMGDVYRGTDSQAGFVRGDKT